MFQLIIKIGFSAEKVALSLFLWSSDLASSAGPHNQIKNIEKHLG
jgi:hypothetical protein